MSDSSDNDELFNDDDDCEEVDDKELPGGDPPSYVQSEEFRSFINN
mgnify:CR=1 FL=1